jgi:predicted nucleotidyltransferase
MEDETLCALVDRLVAALAPRRVILFGSRARGTAKPDSDYDLLVVMDSDLPLEDRLFQARWAVRDIRAPKDILVVTPAEYDRCLTCVFDLVREAKEEGRVLYEAA